MKIHTQLSICAALAVFITVAAGSSSGQQSTGSTRELSGSVQAADKPIAGATVTLYAAGTGASKKYSCDFKWGRWLGGAASSGVR